MKRPLILLLCTYICVSHCFAVCNTHEVQPVCADTWYCIEYYDMFGDIFAFNVQYTLTTDTTIHGQTYRKLMRNDDRYVAALRQSQDGMRVYYCDSVSEQVSETAECLLYDFSANIGDTIKNAYFRLNDIRVYDCFMGEQESVGWLVTDKYTEDDRIHMLVARCYNDGVTTPRYTTHWIQGVGTPNGIWPTLYGTRSYNILYTLCATHGDEMVYSHNLESLGIINDCENWHFNEDALNHVSLSGITICTNGSTLQIQMSNELFRAKIYTLNGQCVLQSSQTDIDVSYLPQGMYILRALTADGQQHQAKFIKE